MSCAETEEKVQFRGPDWWSILTAIFYFCGHYVPYILFKGYKPRGTKHSCTFDLIESPTPNDNPGRQNIFHESKNVRVSLSFSSYSASTTLGHNFRRFDLSLLGLLCHLKKNKLFLHSSTILPSNLLCCLYFALFSSSCFFLCRPTDADSIIYHHYSLFLTE